MSDRALPTEYPELNDVLRDLVRGAQKILGDKFIGAYLQGSFAVGDYDRHSDADFAIVIAAELSKEQVDALQGMHGRLFDCDSAWAQHLEGSYFPQKILGDFSLLDQKLWYLDNGSRSLIESDHCNTLVVRWVLREKGTILAGPPAETLLPPISGEMLRREIWDVINEWGQEILTNKDRFNNRFYQGYIVLSFCRMLHSLHTGLIESKAAGATWAKRNLDPAWSALIDGAWAGRPNPALSVRQPADPEAYTQTLRFVQYCIDESNGRAFFAIAG